MPHFEVQNAGRWINLVRVEPQGEDGVGKNASASEEAQRAIESRLELATEAAQIGIWDWDLATNAFIYSPLAKTICGFPQDKDVTYADVQRATHPDDYPWTVAQSQRAIDPALRDNAHYEYRIVRPDGEVRWVLAHGRAVFETRGGKEEAVRYVGTIQDVTERRRLEEADQLLRSVIDAAEIFVGVVELTDDGFAYLQTNKATAAYYGVPPGRARVDAHETPLSAAEIAGLRTQMLEIWDGGVARTLEYPFSRGGAQTGWYVGTYTPLPPGPQGLPRLSFVVIDVTERKLAEERQHLLIQEVDHRARNALTVVQGLVQLTRESDPRLFKRAVQGRIAAIARAHGLLAEERWTGLDLHRLLADELAPYRTDSPTRIVLTGPKFALAPSYAQSMALVFHELSTNALKYGALSHPQGELRVQWTSSEDGALDLSWAETGPTPVTSPGARKGFGLQLLEETIARQLNGKWSQDWPTTGLHFRLHIPASPTKA